MNVHQLPLEILYKNVKSSSCGLGSKDARNRISEFGLNILESKKRFSILFNFLKQFKNFFALLLISGATLAYIAEWIHPGEGNLYIAIALFLVVILNAIFTFIQEYQSQKIMQSFSKMLPQKTNVLRDKKIVEIESKFLVPGDIVILEEGNKIAVDAVLIDHNNLKVDNSSLTGESEPQLRKLECTHKNILESRNMVFSGTLVQSGNGRALVYGTGMNTQIGKILNLTKETNNTETPLHKELNYFIKIISSIAIFLGFVFFLISLLIGKPLIGSIIFAVGIIVANVPEGLLPTVTLCLSIASKRMAKKNALIKNLESVETLGSTTVICCDKTGTITQNKMVLNTLYLNLNPYNVLEKGISKVNGFDVLLKTMILCNNSRLGDKGKEFMGDPTETSLMNFARNHTNVKRLIKNHLRIHETPFDSETKKMLTTNIVGGLKISYMKGAPEKVMHACSKILINGKIRKILAKDKKIITKRIQKIASRGERVLAFAYKKTKKNKAIEKDFVFIGLAGMLDPPRKEVSEAIKKCHSAGIKVIMITGDYSVTAESIARQVGMMNSKKQVELITGEELANLSQRKLIAALKKENVIFARTNPTQKLKIVKTLQNMGEIVTVTGDGVNDAPALKNADMGVAMGLSGTEVAREASKMVLMDDNFATIVSAIEEGRTIYDNIKKFIAYILTSNVPQILPFIAFVLFAIPLPITVVLILVIDLGTDILPAIGLGSEKPETDVMNKKPRNIKERLLSKELLFRSYGIVGMIQAAAGFFTFFVILKSGGWIYGDILVSTNLLYHKAVTGFFASIIICQIADVWICRARYNSVFKLKFLDNKMLVFGIMVELLILALVAYLPFFNKFLGTAPLSLFELSLSIPFALVILFGDELRKYLLRKGNFFVIKYLQW